MCAERHLLILTLFSLIFVSWNSLGGQLCSTTHSTSSQEQCRRWIEIIGSLLWGKINLFAYTLLVLCVYSDKNLFTCKARTNLFTFILLVLNGLYVIFMVLIAFLSFVQFFKMWKSGLLTLWIAKLLINCGKIMCIKDLKPGYCIWVLMIHGTMSLRSRK